MIGTFGFIAESLAGVYQFSVGHIIALIPSSLAV